MDLPSFSLSEIFALGGSYEWRLKQQEICFRGSGRFQNLLSGRIPVSDEQIAKLKAVLELLGVWDWRRDYNPEDVGWAVCDGSAWKFSAQIDGRFCRCGGLNAYPSYAAVAQTTLNRERFALLVSAIYDIFSIETYILQARLQDPPTKLEEAIARQIIIEEIERRYQQFYTETCLGGNFDLKFIPAESSGEKCHHRSTWIAKFFLDLIGGDTDFFPVSIEIYLDDETGEIWEPHRSDRSSIEKIGHSPQRSLKL
jgi:hypothetical protein